jgi:co-chaperonin GroES (HSP10)
MPVACPIRDKLRVRVLAQEKRSSVIVTQDRETPLRRAEIVALGPDANVRKSPVLAVGQTVLINVLAGQHFNEELIIPASAVVAVLGD